VAQTLPERLHLPLPAPAPPREPSSRLRRLDQPTFLRFPIEWTLDPGDPPSADSILLDDDQDADARAGARLDGRPAVYERRRRTGAAGEDRHDATIEAVRATIDERSTFGEREIELREESSFSREIEFLDRLLARGALDRAVAKMGVDRITLARKRQRVVRCEKRRRVAVVRVEKKRRMREIEARRRDDEIYRLRRMPPYAFGLPAAA